MTSTRRANILEQRSVLDQARWGTSPDWRRLGYMTLPQARRWYWLYRILCAIETALGRKVF